jgi:hypothetical protein
MKHLLDTIRQRSGMLGLAATLLLAGCSSAYKPQAGDLLFQSLPHGRLVDAIEGATASPYSHCGIVEENPVRWTVIEAIGPVKSTTLYEWKKRGRGETIWVYRLKGRTAEERAALAETAKDFLGRPYDIRYRMDDEKIYCSELLYKAPPETHRPAAREDPDPGRTQVVALRGTSSAKSRRPLPRLTGK